MQRTSLICKVRLTIINKHLSRESNKKIATASIEPYFVDLPRNHSFTLSLYHFLLNVMLKEQSQYNQYLNCKILHGGDAFVALTKRILHAKVL